MILDLDLSLDKQTNSNLRIIDNDLMFKDIDFNKNSNPIFYNFNVLQDMSPLLSIINVSFGTSGPQAFLYLPVLCSAKWCPSPENIAAPLMVPENANPGARSKAKIK